MKLYSNEKSMTLPYEIDVYEYEYEDRHTYFIVQVKVCNFIVEEADCHFDTLDTMTENFNHKWSVILAAVQKSMVGNMINIHDKLRQQIIQLQSKA